MRDQVFTIVLHSVLHSHRSALLGVGISHQALTKFAELLKLEAGAGPGNIASKFFAAELRSETGGGELIKH